MNTRHCRYDEMKRPILPITTQNPTIDIAIDTEIKPRYRQVFLKSQELHLLDPPLSLFVIHIAIKTRKCSTISLCMSIHFLSRSMDVVFLHAVGIPRVLMNISQLITQEIF